MTALNKNEKLFTWPAFLTHLTMPAEIEFTSKI